MKNKLIEWKSGKGNGQVINLRFREGPNALDLGSLGLT